MDRAYQAKVEKLIDLIQRACVNHTHKEVAEAIATNWHPVISINGDGKLEVIVERITSNG